MTAPEPAPGVAELRDSPAWFPLEAAAGGAIALLRLDEAAYRAASFLDQRLLQRPAARATVAASVLASAAASLAPCSHFIFHIGHVGSTLLSRLLGAHPAFFALREPALLRALAAGQAGVPPLAVLQGLLNRSWRRGQRALVKATSFVSELAAPMLAASAAPHALLVFAAPPAYVRGILGGPSSRAETAALAPARLERLVRRLGAAGWQSDPRSEGEQVAMSWLSEMLTLREAALRHPQCVSWVDFDAFLEAPLPMLGSMFRALGVEPASGELEALIRGPIMREYSKAPEHAYDAALRREVLAAADWNHGAEIRRGLEWLQAVAAAHAPVRALLEALPRRLSGR